MGEREDLLTLDYELSESSDDDMHITCDYENKASQFMVDIPAIQEKVSKSNGKKIHVMLNDGTSLLLSATELIPEVESLVTWPAGDELVKIDFTLDNQTMEKSHNKNNCLFCEYGLVDKYVGFIFPILYNGTLVRGYVMIIINNHKIVDVRGYPILKHQPTDLVQLDALFSFHRNMTSYIQSVYGKKNLPVTVLVRNLHPMTVPWKVNCEVCRVYGYAHCQICKAVNCAIFMVSQFKPKEILPNRKGGNYEMNFVPKNFAKNNLHVSPLKRTQFKNKNSKPRMGQPPHLQNRGRRNWKPNNNFNKKKFNNKKNKFNNNKNDGRRGNVFNRIGPANAGRSNDGDVVMDENQPTRVPVDGGHDPVASLEYNLRKVLIG